MENSIKTAVVTGISSGIGLALSKKLLGEQYFVIGTTRSGELPEFSHPHLRVVALEANDNLSREQAAMSIRSLSTSIDLLVNNAGTAPDVFAVEPEYAAFADARHQRYWGCLFYGAVAAALAVRRSGGVRVQQHGPAPQRGA